MHTHTHTHKLLTHIYSCILFTISIADDFAIPVMYVTLNSDNLIQCVTIQIINDIVKEVAETLTLSLTTNAENVLFINNSIAINIISDDGESWLHIILHDLSICTLAINLSINLYTCIYHSHMQWLSSSSLTKQ